MNSDQHNLFIKFLKLKPHVFKCIESEDAYDFLVDCHDLLEKMDIVERFDVEFVTYQFQGMSKCGGGLMLIVDQKSHHL